MAAGRACALAGAAILALVAAACERKPEPPPSVSAPSGGATGVAAQSSARTAHAAPAPPGGRSADAAPPADTIDRYFGGRTPAWWSARLTELRKDGPPELYALATRRARAAGLTVEERGDGVSVEPPPRGVYR